MALSEPPSSLDNSCSVIHDNTLYSYSPQGFLALPLEEGTKWKKLASGVKVTGASCVGTTPSDASQAALFIVGGKADSADYTGLQKYTFSTKNWTTITPSDPTATKNRQWHGTAYIQADDAILIYGGSTDGSKTISTQTFTFQAAGPYEPRSHQSNAAPAISPVLLPWSVADAVMVGSEVAGGKVYLFNPNAEWRDFGASLAQPFPTDSSSVRAALVTGDDGSKHLYTFDLSSSPNTASRFVLQDATGKPMLNAAAVKRRSVSSAPPQFKRALNSNNWPKYNSTFAPKTTRQNYALAQGSDGIVVFSGGNAKDPVVIFNVKKNSWVNATALLSDGKQKILDVTSTTSSASSTRTSSSLSTTHHTVSSTSALSTTNTPTPTDSPVAAGGSAHHGPSSNAILGITLGTIAGVLVLLGLVLFCLRKRKNRQKRAEDDDLNPDEKDTVAFAKSTQPSASPNHFRGHYPTLSQESYSSVAILMGRMGPSKAAVSQKPGQDSVRSSVSSLHKQFKSTISKPIPQTASNVVAQGHDDKAIAFAPSVAAPRPRNGPVEARDGTRRSSGWNKYWSGGSALQILGYGNGKRGTVVSEQSSRYSESPSHNPRVTQDSATVPPLNFEGRAEVSRVISGSPVVSQFPSKVPHTEAMAGTIERPVSPVSSGYSSGIPESINEIWNPPDDAKPWGSDRARNSAYAPSTDNGASTAPTNGNTQAPTTSGVSKQPQLAMAATSTDMSWLNLGDHS